jgi:hypothetical protein
VSAKMTPKKGKKFHALKCWCSLWNQNFY